MNYQNPDLDPAHQKRLILAVVLSTIIMGLWYYFYQMPMQKAHQDARAKMRIEQQEKLREQAAKVDTSDLTKAPAGVASKPTELTREEILKESPRILISNGRLHGSIRLIGARLDDITLVNYREALSKTSPEVALMTPSGAANTNFIELGWLASGTNVLTPNEKTPWKVESGKILTPETPVTLSWENGQGQKFFIDYTVDKNFMFNATQRIENRAGTDIKLLPYGLVSKSKRIEEDNFILHTGPIGVMDNTLTEVSYKSLRKDPEQIFPGSTGWIGITDKYWFKSLIPQEGESYKATFRRSENDGMERFQIDYLGHEKTVPANGTLSYSTKIFTGAKELKLLERYGKEYKIPLFERAIDFGWFYFLTKPLYYLLISFYAFLGNFGLAIILLTFCVKLVLFPLARKSYISMGKLKVLQPKISEIQKKYKSDKMALQKHLMDLYKKEKVNPAAGCLPILLQIPIFFSLYKVFFVSIEMRHAPFFGWIKDLSERDPTSIFNLFGLLPWEVPHYLMIGFFPCLMALTMYIQQLLTPAPTDQMAAKMMRMMPLMFLFMFAGFPSGLVIYWCMSNTFTIMQQLFFLKTTPRKK